MKRTSYSRTQTANATEQRRIDGDKRNAAWRALTTAAKIASLDARLGVGIGAVRQRTKLGAK